MILSQNTLITIKVDYAGADHQFTLKTNQVLKEVIDYFNANLK